MYDVLVEHGGEEFAGPGLSSFDLAKRVALNYREQSKCGGNEPLSTVTILTPDHKRVGYPYEEPKHA